MTKASEMRRGEIISDCQGISSSIEIAADIDEGAPRGIPRHSNYLTEDLPRG